MFFPDHQNEHHATVDAMMNNSGSAPSLHYALVMDCMQKTHALKVQIQPADPDDDDDRTSGWIPYMTPLSGGKDGTASKWQIWNPLPAIGSMVIVACTDPMDLSSDNTVVLCCVWGFKSDGA